MLSDYPPADTGLMLTGDVAALRRQVAELTDHNAELLRDKQALRALLTEAIANPLDWDRDDELYCHFCCVVDLSGRDSGPWALTDHADSCLVVRAHTLLTALGESLDNASDSPESPGAEADH